MSLTSHCVHAWCVVSCLVKRGADVKKADLKGRTPLHFAACRGDCSIGQSVRLFQETINIVLHSSPVKTGSVGSY